jgi:DNA polymerase III subunit epsilon
VELTGGRQRGLSLAAEQASAELIVYTHSGHRTPRPMEPSAAELAAHTAFIARLKDPVWTLT